MKVFLETERLILRRFTEDDADHLFELDSDREVIRFTNIFTTIQTANFSTQPSEKHLPASGSFCSIDYYR